MKKKITQNIPKEAQSFHYKAGEKAVCFIHGFTDSLCRVNAVAKLLASEGITTRGILLPGHAQTWRELERTSPKDWYKEVEKELLGLSKECKELFVVGISFGGNLALKFDALHPGAIKGLVLIETPKSIKNQLWTKLRIPFALLFGMRCYNKAGYYKNVNHPEKNIIYTQGVLDKMPLINIWQVIRFLEKEKSYLNKVSTNLFIIQSKKSNIIKEDSAEIICQEVASKRKEILKIENVYHAFLSEVEKAKIFKAAASFFGIEI